MFRLFSFFFRFLPDFIAIYIVYITYLYIYYVHVLRIYACVNKEINMLDKETDILGRTQNKTRRAKQKLLVKRKFLLVAF